jgi:hypothetical protein
MSELAEALRSCMRGKVVLPEDGDYEQTMLAASWNACYATRRPSIIIKPRSTTDVVLAMRELHSRGSSYTVRYAVTACEANNSCGSVGGDA